MNKVIYIGAFTGTQGGVTVKNNLIFSELSRENLPIEKVDLFKVKRGDLSSVWKLITTLLKGESSLIIGASARPRRIISRILYSLNRNTLNDSLLIVMGGGIR